MIYFDYSGGRLATSDLQTLDYGRGAIGSGWGELLELVLVGALSDIIYWLLHAHEDRSCVVVRTREHCK